MTETEGLIANTDPPVLGKDLQHLSVLRLWRSGVGYREPGAGAPEAPHLSLQLLDAVAQLPRSGLRTLGLCHQHPVLFGQLNDLGGSHIPSHTSRP